MPKPMLLGGVILRRFGLKQLETSVGFEHRKRFLMPKRVGMAVGSPMPPVTPVGMPWIAMCWRGERIALSYDSPLAGVKRKFSYSDTFAGATYGAGFCKHPCKPETAA